MTLMPTIGKVGGLRSRGAIVDAIMEMSPDGSPINDRMEIGGLDLNCGGCHGGFKAVPGWG